MIQFLGVSRTVVFTFVDKYIPVIFIKVYIVYRKKLRNREVMKISVWC